MNTIVDFYQSLSSSKRINRVFLNKAFNKPFLNTVTLKKTANSARTPNNQDKNLRSVTYATLASQRSTLRLTSTSAMEIDMTLKSNGLRWPVRIVRRDKLLGLQIKSVM